MTAVISSVALATGCAAGRPRAGPPPRTNIEVLAAWTGAEQHNFERVTQAFEQRTGVQVTYTAARPDVPAALQARVAAGTPPDVAFLPQPGTLRQYAAAGLAVPLDRATLRVVSANYNSVWQELASYRGREYGVWFKAADKSLVWYNIASFEKVGVVPPEDLAGLLRVAHSFEATGLAAFAVGGANRWTLSDWFSNLYLQVAGPHRYDRLASHQMPWTDPSVEETLGLMAQVLAPGLLAGGVQGALRTTFQQSVAQVLSVHPLAAMTSEAEFVLGAVPASSQALSRVDFDAFPFPGVGASTTGVVVGGDVAVMLRKSAAAAAFLRYLATPEAAALWAGRGGFISPNLKVDLASYPDDIIRGAARRVLEAGTSLRFGLGDLQPPAFGASASAGLQKGLADLLVSGDVRGTAVALERAAVAAFPR